MERTGARNKIAGMANLVLVYGMRLLPADEVVGVGEAPVTLLNGNQAHVTMHVLEGSREQIEAQLKQSVDAFFDFYPEI
ncbi:MAG: allantoinase [Acidobacteriaceae bacterium]